MKSDRVLDCLNDVENGPSARSQTAQLAEFFDEIEKLVARRYKLKFIYEALVKAGCTLTFGSFKVALARIRKTHAAPTV